jgi:hypothetical protein
LPPEGSRIIVGPEDELAELFFKGRQPLPIGHRVIITSLMGGDDFLMTVGWMLRVEKRLKVLAILES